jgi:hypothetical protein
MVTGGRLQGGGRVGAHMKMMCGSKDSRGRLGLATCGVGLSEEGASRG